MTTAPHPEHSLEDCAARVLAQLPKHIAEHVREVAYIYNRQPLWSLVAGHCLKAYENGDVQAPMLDPSWPRQFPTLGVDPSKQLYTCAICSVGFTPKRYKQQYCSQECGAVAAAKVHAAAALKQAARDAEVNATVAAAKAALEAVNG